MTMRGEATGISQDQMDIIATYMDDEIREQVHHDIAPCTPEEFLVRYCQIDRDFERLLYREFDILV